MLKFIYLLIFIVFNVANTTFICSSNHTVILSSDEIFFFQSSNFLNNLTEVNKDGDNFCEINFMLNSSILVGNKRFYLVLTNIINMKTRIPTDMYTVVNQATIYSFKKSMINESFQGFAIFDDWGDNSCPLESISRIKPFFLSNENQIITLNSSYFLNDSRKHPCLWQFTAPPNYGFKIVITAFNLANSVDLMIKNSTDLIWTQHNVKTFHPYYNVDKYLQISLSTFPNLTSAYSAEAEFSAYITIVKKEWNNLECNTIVLQNSTTWSTPFGYPNNANCKYQLTIPSNTEVIVKASFDFEKNVDFLQYFSDDDEKVILESDTVLFGHTTNNTSDKNISFELVSDGSISKGGFNIEFEYVKCECANSSIVVDCDRSLYYYLMNESARHDSQYYCGNLRCNFTIKPNLKCPDKFVSLRIRLNFQGAFFDSFRMHTNNTVTTEIAFLPTRDIYYNWIFNTILSPYVENIFEAITQPSTDISKVLELYFTPIEAPQIEKTIILTSEMQNFNERTYFKNHLIAAEMSAELLSQGYIMEIYGDLYEVTFYENPNMAHKLTLNQCTYNKNRNECQMTKTKVYAYIENFIENDPKFLFFHAVNRNFSNCLFGNDVFYLSTDSDQNKKHGISAFANKNGICTIYLLTWETTISNIWTTAKNDNVIVYSGNNKEKMFELNQTTSHFWKNIAPYQQYYIFEIPPNASLLLSLDNHSADAISIIDTFPYKTIINFPFTSDFTPSSYQPLLYFIRNFDVLFTVSQFNISKNYEMMLIFENGTVKSFSTFDKLTIYAPSIFIISYDYSADITDITWEPNVIVFLETISVPLSTTSSQKVISTTTYVVENNAASNYNYSKILMLFIFVFVLRLLVL